MMLPLWPKKKFSDLNIAGEWIDYKSEAIDIDDFIYEWIPNLKAENSGICLFWLNNESIHVEIDAFERDLKRELEKY